MSPALMGYPGASDGKESACNAEDPGSIPGSRRSHGEGNGNPPQYSCLEHSMDRGRLQSMGSQKSQYDWATDTFTKVKHHHFHPRTGSLRAYNLAASGNGSDALPGLD